MPFRRPFFSKRPARRFSRFRRRRISTVHRPIRWERGNFHLTVNHFHSNPDRLLNTIIPIANPQNFGDTTSATGRTLNQNIRALHVGGVKFTVAQWLVDSDIGQDPVNENLSTLVGSLSTKVLLVSDSTVTDSAAGTSLPQAIESNFFTNTQPVAAATAGEIQDVENLYPRRIHWQNYKSLNQWASNFYELSGEPPEIIPYAPQQQGMVNTHSGANLKLNLRLEDDEMLCFFVTSFLDVNSFALEPECVFRISGTIWYRYQF